MLTKIAHRMTNALISDEQDEKQRAIYEYGCELWLYTVISTLGLLLIGTILGYFFETAAMISVFYLCQSNGGGYHAASHIRCFLIMVISLLLGLIFLKVLTSDILFTCILLFSTAILLLFPLHLHPNKQYLLAETSALSKRSRIITLFIAISIYAVGNLISIKIAYSGCIAILLSSISRVYAIVTTTTKAQNRL